MKVTYYPSPHLPNTMMESSDRAQHDGADGRMGDLLVSKKIPFQISTACKIDKSAFPRHCFVLPPCQPFQTALSLSGQPWLWFYSPLTTLTVYTIPPASRQLSASLLTLIVMRRSLQRSVQRFSFAPSPTTWTKKACSIRTIFVAKTTRHIICLTQR